MYLSKCIINGFKSFADKTEINFNQGLSAIVGPNGSGKSNIYESIMWVLGEQRAKSLRSNKMEDVIFAGSSGRSEVGMAEVILVISDPECELMGVAEVQITRRLFRNGQSDYYLNGKTCRLKDISKILANTGIGKNSYSFIGQGKIEEILKSRPHELRLLFEEAAGIAHYKEQKFTTQAQLNKTQDSITRIDDLIQELEVDVENLRIRAKKATKHQELTAELNEMSRELVVSEYIISNNKLLTIREKIRELKFDLSTNEIEQEGLNNALVLGETKVTELGEVKNNNEKDIIRLDNTVQNYKNKLSDLSDTLLSIKEQYEIKNDELNDIKQTQHQNLSKINNTKQELKSLNYSLDGNVQKVEELGKDISHLRGQLVDLDLESLEQEKSLSEQKIGSLRQRANDLIDRIHTSKQQLNKAQARYAELTDKNDIEIGKLDTIKQRLQQDINKHKELVNEDEQLSSNLVKYQDALNKLTNNISDLREQKRNQISQLTLNQKLQSEYTGYFAGVKSVLLEKKRNPNQYSGVVGVVAELIKVKEELQIAISAVLGGQAQYLVSKTARDATNAINMLKQKRAGKATFLPLNRIEPRLNTVPHSLKNNPHLLGRAIDLIQYNTEATTAIKYLLNNVLVVRSVEAALEISKQKLPQFLIVTLSGEVFSGRGSISGGRNKKDHNADLIARNEKIAKLQSDLKHTNELLANYEQQFTSNKSKYNELGLQLEAVKKQIITFSKEINNNEKQEFFLQTLLSKIKDEMSSLEHEIKECSNNIGRYEEENKDNLQLIEKSSGALKYSSDELNKARSLINQLNSKTSLEAELKAEIRLIENKINNSNANIAIYEATKESLDKQILKVSQEIEQLQIKINEMQETYDETLNNFDEWEQKLFTKTEELKRITSEFLKASDEQVTNGEKLKSLQIAKEQLGRSIQRYDRRLIEQETIHKFIEAELYQVNIDKEQCKTDNKITSRTVEQLKLKVNKLKSMINSLGDVDYGAIADLKRREERISFLNQQRSDLEDAKLKLTEVIGEVDKICYDKLADTIEVVRGNFKEIFTELFQGGYADIQWDNDGDIFSSGIILKVSPPGKKVQNMDQLSGGEKSLTAIALLMSFTKMKTSSFCIFDEVDAALDETNNIRLAKYWQTISKRTQVLAVTHSRHTMVHADNLYGVVMQEKGVSKIISVTLD